MTNHIKNWKPDQMGDVAGKRVLITGGNSGIGLQAARELAQRGANILIGARNEEKAQQAVHEIKTVSKAEVDYVILDLSDMSSVKACAKEVSERWDSIDILINNAGIMQTPQTKTIDGFELQFATNHLGHFLLNGLLFSLLEKVSGRIVVVASIAHKFGKMQFEDLMHEKSYDPMEVYAQSKLANLLYARELSRRLSEKGSRVTCVACHPGYSSTNLQSTGPTGFFKKIYTVTNKVWAQPAKNGAYPTLLAAAGKEAVHGGYYGPKCLAETRGPVGVAKVSKRALDQQTMKRLWSVSEELLEFTWGL